MYIWDKSAIDISLEARDGLTVHNRIYRRHHGAFRVRSRQIPGRSGTVFTLFLPYQAATPHKVNAETLV